MSSSGVTSFYPAIGFPRRQRKHIHKSTKVATISTTSLTIGIIAVEIGLFTGLIFVGSMAIARGSGAVIRENTLCKV
jgi:hypothetical protein